MKIGNHKEIKNYEYWVGLTPGSVAELTNRGHSVLLECGAGDGIGASDASYVVAGGNTDVGRGFSLEHQGAEDALDAAA